MLAVHVELEDIEREKIDGLLAKRQIHQYSLVNTLCYTVVPGGNINSYNNYTMARMHNTVRRDLLRGGWKRCKCSYKHFQ